MYKTGGFTGAMIRVCRMAVHAVRGSGRKT
jgi:hypothetical protein